MFGIRSNRWKDDDEYKRARWAYEGQGASATKAAWFLGAALIAMTVYAGMQRFDVHSLASLGEMKFVAMETNRTTGDLVSISMTDGKLMVSDTKRRQFLKYWITLWRAVPADQVAYNQNYLASQAYMAEPVYNAIAEHMAENPADKFIKGGYARMVRDVQATPSGNGVRYRLDWVESTYRNSQLVNSIRMTADVDLDQHTPKNDAEAEGNLFGLVIKGFYWTAPPNTQS